ncbi:MAG: type VI secretion system tip protein TssI/VgrG [Byssovorax sp.]
MTTLDCDLEVDLGDVPHFTIVSLALTEGLSVVDEARLVIATNHDIDFDRVLMGDARLTLVRRGEPVRRWSMKIGSADLLGIEDGAVRFAVGLHAAPWLLGHAQNLRKFRDRSVEEVVSAVLSEGKVPHRWNLTRQTPSRPFTVQYRETNLAFVQRLLEFEGIYFSFDEDGTMVLEDKSSASQDVAGSTFFELTEAAGALSHGQAGVHALRKLSRVRSGKFTAGDFDWKKPSVKLLESSSAERDADLELYEHPSGFREPGEGSYLAQIRLEAERVSASRFEGKGSAPTFAPARIFTFGGNGGAAFSGEHLITRVAHHFESSTHADGARKTYENRFETIPRGVPFRPRCVTPRPKVLGTHTAMVRGPAGAEIHTDRHGRHKVQFHWDREAVSTDADSRWIRALQEPSTSMALARVGWEVNVGYIHGDPERPVGLSRHINGVMKPTYAQPDNKTMMTIKTPSSPYTGGFNELKLDDNAGSMLFYLQAERDYLGLVKHDKSEKVGNDETHSIGANLTRAVSHDQTIGIGVDSVTTVGEHHQLAVKQNRTRTLGQNETVEVGETASRSTGGDEKETVGAARMTVAGGLGPGGSASSALTSAAMGAGMALASGGGIAGAMASAKSSAAGMVSHGTISRTTSKAIRRAVGGAFVSVSGDNTTTSVTLAYAETVGGDKSTTAMTGGISEQVDGPLTITVSGSVVRTSKDDMLMMSKQSKMDVATDASYSAGKRMQVSGKVIEIDAPSTITLGSGGLEIAFDPGSIRMTGTVRFVADKISHTGNTLTLTTG